MPSTQHTAPATQQAPAANTWVEPAISTTAETTFKNLVVIQTSRKKKWIDQISEWALQAGIGGRQMLLTIHSAGLAAGPAASRCQTKGVAHRAGVLDAMAAGTHTAQRDWPAPT